MYVNEILLVNLSLSLLKEVKNFPSNNFDMKDIGRTNHIIDIDIYRSKTLGILGLSQRSYLLEVLKKISIENNSFSKNIYS